MIQVCKCHLRCPCMWCLNFIYCCREAVASQMSCATVSDLCRHRRCPEVAKLCWTSCPGNWPSSQVSCFPWVSPGKYLQHETIWWHLARRSLCLPLGRHRFSPLSYSWTTASLTASLVIWAASRERCTSFSSWILFGKISSHVWENTVVLPADDREKPENFVKTAMLSGAMNLAFSTKFKFIDVSQLYPSFWA